jgi:phosphatidate cytidylyltransferase
MVLMYYFALPRWGFLERSFLERSGLSAQENPILFYWLYDKNLQVSMVLLSVFFLVIIMNWRLRNSRYMLKKMIGIFLVLIYLVSSSTFATKSYMVGGRWWILFAVCSVALNDASAYFAGKCFGKHQLIGLSPNKTIEGFVGGIIMNVLITYIVARYYFHGIFWQCAPNRLNYKPFEEYKCDEILSIYIPYS